MLVVDRRWKAVHVNLKSRLCDQVIWRGLWVNVGLSPLQLFNSWFRGKNTSQGVNASLLSELVQVENQKHENKKLDQYLDLGLKLDFFFLSYLLFLTKLILHCEFRFKYKNLISSKQNQKQTHPPINTDTPINSVTVFGSWVVRLGSKNPGKKKSTGTWSKSIQISTFCIMACRPLGNSHHPLGAETVHRGSGLLVWALKPWY